MTDEAMLPDLYGRWLKACLSGPIPAESQANCAHCVMLPLPGEAAPAGFYFEPAIKCCSYLPELHNFLTGQILNAQDPDMQAGRRTVEARIAAGAGVTPLGLAPAADYMLLYRHSRPAFGRSKALRCPHYLEEGGHCGIWKYRESTCATWFCKHRRGALGQSFWRDYLQPLLAWVEHSLALWCALELGFELEALRPYLTPTQDGETEGLQPEQLERRADPRAQKRLWRHWLGREEEWYRACARQIAELEWQQVLAICGPEAKAMARLARQAYERLLDHRLPPRLEPAACELVQIRDGTLRISSYSALDPVEIPSAILPVLHYFRDCKVREAIEAIAEQENIRLSDDLVIKLADFGLLQTTTDREAEEPPDPRPGGDNGASHLE